MSLRDLRSQAVGSAGIPHKIGGYFSDSFNRANSTGLGTSNTGQTWTDRTNGFNISSGHAVVRSNGLVNVATMPCGSANVEIEVTLTVGAGTTDGGIILHFSGTTYIFARIQPSSVDILDSGFTTRATTSGSFPNGSVVRLKTKCVGAAVLVYVNETFTLGVTNSTNNSATDHGLWGSDTTMQFSNFMVRPLDAHGDPL